MVVVFLLKSTVVLEVPKVSMIEEERGTSQNSKCYYNGLLNQFHRLMKHKVQAIGHHDSVPLEPNDFSFNFCPTNSSQVQQQAGLFHNHPHKFPLHINVSIWCYSI